METETVALAAYEVAVIVKPNERVMREAIWKWQMEVLVFGFAKDKIEEGI